METRVKTTTYYQKLHMSITIYYSKEDELMFCNNIDGLGSGLGYKHILKDWRFFIDKSKHNLKAVSLHSGNILPSFHVADGAH